MMEMILHDCDECEMRHPKSVCFSHHENHPYPIKWSWWPAISKKR